MSLPPRLLKVSHNNRELKLMLAGSKPLAMFYAEVVALPNEKLIPEKAFSAYVKSGRFVRGEDTFRYPHPHRRGRMRVRYVFFALAKEAWRIPAMKLVLETSDQIGHWNEGIERMTGGLLGYRKAEVDWWWKYLVQSHSV